MIYFEDIELNRQHVSGEYTVSKEEIITFARQWDPQPYHTDETAAQAWPLGLTASSTHSYALLTKLQVEIEGDKPAIVAGLGIDEWRMPTPMRPGDRVHAVSYVESKRESASKPTLGIIVSVSQLVNQDKQVILTYKSTGLALKRPA